MQKQNSLKIFLSVICYSLLILFYTGCVKGTDTVQSTTTTSLSNVEVFNLTPLIRDSASFYINNNLFPEAFLAGGYTNFYTQIPSGTYDINFKSISGDSLLYDIPNAKFDSAANYSIFLYSDSLKGHDKAIVVTDNLSTISLSNASYRFIHMAPDIASADLYINGIKVQSGRTPADIVTNTSYQNFVSYAPGYVSIEVKATGSSTDISTPLTLSLQPYNAYTVFLEELVSSTGTTYSLNLVQVQ